MPIAEDAAVLVASAAALVIVAPLAETVTAVVSVEAAPVAVTVTVTGTYRQKFKTCRAANVRRKAYWAGR